MDRKIPLLPTWLFMAGVFGSPFIRKALIDRGTTVEAASNVAISISIVLVLLAGIAVYWQRDRIPPEHRLKRSKWLLWKKRGKETGDA